MKLFGWKAGRDESRPALEVRRTRFAEGVVGAVPQGYARRPTAALDRELADMSAESVVQAAALTRLRAVAGLNGVYLGPPVKATVPYAELGDVLSVDWSVKDRVGRELRLAVTVRDASETPERAQVLAEGVCDAIEGLPRDLSGWRVGSVVLVRSRVVGGPAGRWLATVEYRVRVLAA